MSDIKRYDVGKRISRVTEHQGVLYFTGHVAAGKQASIEAQTKALLERYDELLDQFGSDKHHILFATVYLSDMKDKEGMDAVWETWIEEGKAPARVCIEAGLSPGYLLEITLVAARIE